MLLVGAFFLVHLVHNVHTVHSVHLLHFLIPSRFQRIPVPEPDKIEYGVEA